MKAVTTIFATIMLAGSAYVPLAGDKGYPELPVQGPTPVSSWMATPQDGEPQGFPGGVGEDRPILPQNCISKMCFGDSGVGAGQRLAFAALSNRSFSVTKEAARRAVERRIDVEKIAKYGTLKKTNNGTAYVRYGSWEARLSLRNGTIMTVVIW